MVHVLRTILRPFRHLSDMINKLPLSGKFFVRRILFWAYTSTPDRKMRNTLLALLVLVALIFFHSSQMVMGWDLYSKTSLVFAQIVGITYGILNALVIYSHCILSIRLVGMARRSYQHCSYRRRQTSLRSTTYMLFCFVVTLGGQIVFLTTYFRI